MARPLDLPAAVASRLAERGVPLDDPVRALDLLAERWGEDPEAEAAIVALAGAATSPEVGARLAALAERTSHKGVKREIKRALYRLEQRGLWTRPAAPPPPPKDLLGPSESEPEAWVSAIDPSGSRLLWMARRTPQGVATLSAVINEEKGLEEFYAGETTRKMLRQAQRDLVERSGMTLVEVPWPHADALLRAAVERSSDRSRDAAVARTRRQIVPREASVPPPVDAFVDRAEAAADESALAASAEALAEKELGGWLLPRDWVEPALAAVEEAQTSVLVLTPQQREERVRDALRDAANRIFEIEGRRARFADRLDETAYLLARRDRVDLARALVAAAQATRAGRPIAEIPVLAQITARSVGLALELRAEQAREEARSSLIVTPAQALAEQRRLAQLRRR